MISHFVQHLRSVLINWRSSRKAALGLGKPVLLLSVIVTASVMGIRHLGALEAWELGVFDYLMRLRPDEGPDPRLLVIAVTDADIQKRREYPLSDRTILELVQKLVQYQPRVIGLDIYRDVPQGQGYAELVKYLQASDRLVVVCEMPELNIKAGVAPPPGIPEDRLGFTDFVLDPDGIVRRNLLFMTPEPGFDCATPYSFSLQLAKRYLAQEGIQPRLTADEHLQFGPVVFKPLTPNSGGYQRMDTAGYQILLNYRSPHSSAQQVSLTEFLSGQVNPEWIRDRIVVIGVTATSVNDTFYTPYTTRRSPTQRMPGIVVHTQMTSQLLSAVLDRRPLFWFWPEWAEGLWIWGWSLVGGLLVWRIQAPLRLGLAGGAALAIIGGVYFGLFTQSGWVPLTSPILALALTGGSVMAYQIRNQPQDQRQQMRDRLIDPVRTSGTTALTEQTMADERDVILTDSTGLPPRLDVRLGGRYQVQTLLGSGGFGMTYLAEDTQRPGRPLCVVKRLMPARQDAKSLQIARRLFTSEAESLEKLGNHSQIPQLLAYFEEDQEFYLVEEFVPGHSLNEELLVGKRFAEAQVIDLLQNLLEVLAFIHSHQVIHRDIKPNNIIRRESNRQLVLIDFGAVKQIQSPLHAEWEELMTVAIGTRGYAPPEQMTGHPNYSSDIYAVGMVGIQALTGVLPQNLQQDPQTGSVIWRPLAEVSENLAAILDNMVQYHFKERYASAQAVLQDLQLLLEMPSDRHSH